MRTKRLKVSVIIAAVAVIASSLWFVRHVRENPMMWRSVKAAIGPSSLSTPTN
jgi:hypothetical protein